MSNAKIRHRRRRRVAKHVRSVLMTAIVLHLEGKSPPQKIGDPMPEELHKLIIEKWGYLF